MKYRIKDLENKHITMILDGLELLSWVIKTKKLFGLSVNYDYEEKEVNSLYKDLKNNYNNET